MAAPEEATPPLFDRVDEVIRAFRPFIQSDGGDIELVAVEDGGTVKVRLRGACVGCPASAMTLKLGIERQLRARVPEVKEVVNVR